jgi:hypothetical protein
MANQIVQVEVAGMSSRVAVGEEGFVQLAARTGATSEEKKEEGRPGKEERRESSISWSPHLPVLLHHAAST